MLIDRCCLLLQEEPRHCQALHAAAWHRRTADDMSSEPHAVLPPHMPASAVAAAAFPLLLIMLCLFPLISAAATAATAARYHCGCQQIMTHRAAVAAVAKC